MSTQKILRMLFFSAGLGACTIRVGPLDENAALGRGIFGSRYLRMAKGLR